jgi:hypothetical protein
MLAFFMHLMPVAWLPAHPVGVYRQKVPMPDGTIADG